MNRQRDTEYGNGARLRVRLLAMTSGLHPNQFQVNRGVDCLSIE